ncbi:MAG: hypothetical protein GEEBNDBF_00011 [bacterium]|nr:hypothetical protein [bacterium]
MSPRVSRTSRLVLVGLLMATLPACSGPSQETPAARINNESLLKRLEAEVSEDPCRWQSTIALADTYRQRQKVGEATRLYEHLLTCGDPMAQGLALNALGQLAQEQGNHDEAAAQYWHGTSGGNTRTQSQSWFLLGELLRTTSKIPALLLLPSDDQPAWISPDISPAEAAEAAYAQAVATGQPAPEVFLGLAEIALTKGAKDLALEDFQLYLAASPDDMEVWLRAAVLAAELEQPELARFYCEMVQSRGSEVHRKQATALLGQLPAPEATEPPAES